jgi:hypothetical protein
MVLRESFPVQVLEISKEGDEKFSFIARVDLFERRNVYRLHHRV